MAETKIGEKHVNLLAVEYICCPSDIRGDIHIVIVLKQTAQPVACVFLVVDDEDNGLKVHIGTTDTINRRERRVHRDSKNFYGVSHRSPQFGTRPTGVALVLETCIIARCTSEFFAV